VAGSPTPATRPLNPSRMLPPPLPSVTDYRAVTTIRTQPIPAASASVQNYARPGPMRCPQRSCQCCLPVVGFAGENGISGEDFGHQVPDVTAPGEIEGAAIAAGRH